MGILGDIISGKKRVVIENVEDKKEDELIPTPYNRIWLNSVAHRHGYEISDNDKKVDNILKALNKKDGYCPCGGSTNEDFKCPCKMMREYNACKCGLYKESNDINTDNISTEVTARIKDE